MENENFDFFKKFYLVFKHVLCINPSENGHIFDFLNFFFKNEAFNKKSEMVHFLGYESTCFHDSSGPRKLILRMPRPYSEPHENGCIYML